MKILLDTHIFLWFISGDRRLPEHIVSTVRSTKNEVYLSAVSIWEAVIKYKLGKLPLPESPESYLPRQRKRHHIASLPVDEACVMHLSALPSHHRDPFDRMLICQALEHDLVLATVDEKIRNYLVNTLQ
ncbi:MAG: type II toxin-antitoxin system VapC family toxin [Candidatus Electrothrix aestuarii]|uniref:Type II toxin-antitoxin system VapC family toxin n=1 Tax=Candidatus Electrothrix aestuarii TaxID=3062594 RepID=A0AAU8LUD0_9BACT|nr:type II toxin-antitoxin system VapC family toxin [Candidatus Electrothrix aestuarii]